MERNRKRPCHIVAWTTPEEKEMIRERMRECGYDEIGKYVRRMAIDGFIIHVDYTDVKELSNQIRRVGININQIAKRANETEAIYQGDIDELNEMMREIWRLQRSNLLRQPLEKQ